MAHQIKQIFQYQEERQRSDSWEGPNDDGVCLRKKPHGHMSAAELTYFEHKSKLKRTQLQRPGTILDLTILNIFMLFVMACELVIYM